MIRSLRSACAISFAIFLTILPANAYIRYTTNNGVPLFRGNAVSAIVYVHSSAHAGFVNSDGDVIIDYFSNPMQAITAAAAEWTTPETSIHFLIQPGTVSRKFNDGISIATFEDTPDNRSIVGDAVAVTELGFYTDGTMTDTDLIFNPTEFFSTNLAEGSYDIETIAAHELGHALGLDHSPMLSAAMFPAAEFCAEFIPSATCSTHTLSSDDLAFAATIYPNVPAARGSILGTVSTSAGVRVNGGFVTAVDPATGVTVSGVTSSTNGTYRLDGLPAGSYLVFAQAATGPVYLDDLSVGFSPSLNTTFKTTFAGGNLTPTLIGVTKNSAGHADITVATGPGARRMDFMAVGAYGADIPGLPEAGRVSAASNRSANIFIWGQGMDESVTENQIRLIGPGITLHPGSLHLAPDFVLEDFSPLEFTVDIAPVQNRTPITVGVATNEDGALFSGGLVLLPAPPLPTLTKIVPGEVTAGTGSFLMSVTGTNFTASSTVQWNGSARSTIRLNSTTLTANIPAADTMKPGTVNIAVADPLTGDTTASLTFTIDAPIVIVQPPSISQVLNGASLLPGISPGAWVAIKGANLANTDPGRIWRADEVPNGVLPTLLDGVSVTMNGKPAFVYYISATQVNVLAPTDLGTGPVSVVVTNNGNISATASAISATAAPAFFLYGATSYAIVSHFPDYALLGSPAAVPGTKPAKPGDTVILWGTGFGPTDPATPNGTVIAGAYSPLQSQIITLNGTVVNVIGAAMTSGSAGLTQIAFQLPLDLPAGDVEVRAQVGTAKSPVGVNIFVQP